MAKGSNTTTMETSRKSCVAYCMAPIPVSLKVTFAVWNYLAKYNTYIMLTHELEVYVAYNFDSCQNWRTSEDCRQSHTPQKW